MVLVNVVVVEEVFSRHTSHLELAQASVLEDLIRKKVCRGVEFLCLPTREQTDIRYIGKYQSIVNICLILADKSVWPDI